MYSLCVHYKYKLKLRPVVAQEHKCVTVNATGCWFDPYSRKLNIKYCHFFKHSFNTQCFQNLEENGERIVLTLGSSRLPCCVQDTAWSCKKSKTKRLKKKRFECIINHAKPLDRSGSSIVKTAFYLRTLIVNWSMFGLVKFLLALPLYFLVAQVGIAVLIFSYIFLMYCFLYLLVLFIFYFHPI